MSCITASKIIIVFIEAFVFLRSCKSCDNYFEPCFRCIGFKYKIRPNPSSVHFFLFTRHTPSGILGSSDGRKLRFKTEETIWPDTIFQVSSQVT